MAKTKLNPCAKDCPRRALGCQAACPEWAEAQALRAEIRKAKKHDAMVRGYFKDVTARRRRKATK